MVYKVPRRFSRQMDTLVYAISYPLRPRLSLVLETETPLKSSRNQSRNDFRIPWASRDSHETGGKFRDVQFCFDWDITFLHNSSSKSTIGSQIKFERCNSFFTNQLLNWWPKPKRVSQVVSARHFFTVACKIFETISSLVC
jgi:hypothetical protein